MLVFADIRRQVSVDPVEVISKLIEESIGEGWIATANGKFYRYRILKVGH